MVSRGKGIKLSSARIHLLEPENKQHKEKGRANRVRSNLKKETCQRGYH
jgi:hypothetical protein